MRLNGKVAIVTGCARGIGKETVLALTREGACVVGVDVFVDEGAKVIDAVKDAGGEAMFIAADVAAERDWSRVIEEAVTSYGGLQILVNNAGISGSSAAIDDGIEAWERFMSVNAASVFLGATHAVPAMTQGDGGSIVNVSSMLGIVGGSASHPGYHASKAAVRNFTKAAAVRYGPQGIRVNSVHPGYLPAMRGVDEQARQQRIESEKLSNIPLRRMGESHEVASGIAYLASDDASYVTGSELVIDGGFLAQ